MSAVPGFDHQPCWCEENVWRLCREARFAASETLVAIVASDSGAVRVRHQRAARGGAVDWDYHVVLFARAAGEPWACWDLDTTLGLPVAATRWLDESFAEPIPIALRPRFRVLAGADYLATLSSDRSHMRAGDGSWLQPPPPWPPILAGAPNLRALVDPRVDAPGRVVGLAELRGCLA